MSPRTGRPPVGEPKYDTVKARIDHETKGVLDAYTEQKRVTVAEAIRRGIHKLKDELDGNQ